MSNVQGCGKVIAFGVVIDLHKLFACLEIGVLPCLVLESVCWHGRFLIYIVMQAWMVAHLMLHRVLEGQGTSTLLVVVMIFVFL